jgi:hypothetical protein
VKGKIRIEGVLSDALDKDESLRVKIEINAVSFVPVFIDG